VLRLHPSVLYSMSSVILPTVSSSNDVRIPAGPSHPIGRSLFGEEPKIKKPGLLKKDRGRLHRCLHRLPSKTDCEACSGGSSDSRINLQRPAGAYPLRLPCPFPSRHLTGQWFRQVSSPITAAWPSPIFTGFPSDSNHLNTDRIIIPYHKKGGNVNFRYQEGWMDKVHRRFFKDGPGFVTSL
jgi:hypothetical protein